jgi:hypothetical protein
LNQRIKEFSEHLCRAFDELDGRISALEVMDRQTGAFQREILKRVEALEKRMVKQCVHCQKVTGEGVSHGTCHPCKAKQLTADGVSLNWSYRCGGFVRRRGFVVADDEPVPDYGRRVFFTTNDAVEATSECLRIRNTGDHNVATYRIDEDGYGHKFPG